MASVSSSSELFTQESEGTIAIRYRECWRNHAVLTGGYAADGCGEFIPKADQGTKEVLVCEACNCHRNFHRKELIRNGIAFPGSHFVPPMWCGERNSIGPYPLPLALSQPSLYPYHHHHHYSQNEVQDMVDDEESAICSRKMETKARTKRMKRKLNIK